jgi:hypothetical protein
MLNFSIIGLPTTMGAGQLRSLISTAKSTISDDSINQSQVEVFRCPDPANSSLPTPAMDSGDIAGLRQKFSFLKDFSDEFIRKTPPRDSA